MYSAQLREEIRENRTIKREIDARLNPQRITRGDKPWQLSQAGSQETLYDGKLLEEDSVYSCVEFSDCTTMEPQFLPGVVFEYYQGTFDLLPDFDSSTPFSAGSVLDFNIDGSSESRFIKIASFGSQSAASSPSRQSIGDDRRSTTALGSGSGHRSILDMGNFACRFVGYIEIPSDGLWTFSIGSNDGSVLYIDGKQLVNNDGVHYMTEKSGSLSLTAGKHTISVLYFHKNGKLLEGLRTGAQLAVYVQCKECAAYEEKTLIPGSMLFYETSQASLSVNIAGRDSAFGGAADLRQTPSGETTRAAQMQRIMNEQKQMYQNEMHKMQQQIDIERGRSSKLVAALQNLAMFSPPPEATPDFDEYTDSLIELVDADVEKLKQLYFISTGLSIKMASQQTAQRQEASDIARASLKQQSSNFLSKLFVAKHASSSERSLALKQSSLIATRPLGRKLRNVDLHDLYEDVLKHGVPVEDWGKVLNQVFLLAGNSLQ